MSKKNLFPIMLVGLILIGGFFLFSRRGVENEKGVLSNQQAGQKVLELVNKKFLKGKPAASLGDVVEENGVYNVAIIKTSGQVIHSYVTKDGSLFFPQGIDLAANASNSTTPPVEKSATAALPKQDVPDIKLFVMSYCPYGLQTQKMFLPVYKLLKDKAKMSIDFVDYAMHGKKELDENLRQYCIQKYQPSKYIAYLTCFVSQGKSQDCLDKAKIDQTKMQSCMSNIDKQYKVTQGYNDKSTWSQGQFPQFSVEKDLNEKYKITGSPTIVINGQQTSVSPRSPEKFKEVICSAFNNPPVECSKAFSDKAFSPGLGYDSGSNNSSGSCK